MIRNLTHFAAASALALVALSPQTVRAQEIELIIALPAPTLTFSAAFIAEDAGFYKAEGLKVTHRNLVGVAAANAVIAGSADFTIGTAPVFLRAASQGQKMLAIANLVDKMLVEFVLRKDVADSLGVTDKMPLAERAKKLNGKTIGIQGVGSIVHAWERLVVSRGGLDVEKDVRIAPMDPPAMLPALENKAIDGFATSLPFTTQAVSKGVAIMFASGTDAMPDLLPFPYNLVYGKPETCQQKRDACFKLVQAYTKANQMIVDRPAEALEILKKRFDKMDPALLAAAWTVVARSHTKDLRIPVKGLSNAERVNVEAKFLKPEEQLKSYDGLYTNEFIK